jgi:hypothetical protein
MAVGVPTGYAGDARFTIEIFGLYSGLALRQAFFSVLLL